MKAYIINLKRSAKRREHIVAEAEQAGLDYVIVDAVDGALLSDDELNELCDIDTVRKYPEWLSLGMIGCVLSHKRAYRRFLATNDKTALVIEDDAVLPAEFRTIAEKAAESIEPDEVQLFFYSRSEPLELSTVNGLDLDGGYRLLYPMTLDGVTGAVCYMIGREAARALMHDNVPISLASDCWDHFYARGFISKARVVYPMPVHHLGVKSVISSTVQSGIRAWLTNWIDRHEVPIINHWLVSLRNKNLLNRSRFVITEKVSSYSLEAKFEQPGKLTKFYD